MLVATEPWRVSAQKARTRSSRDETASWLPSWGMPWALPKPMWESKATSEMVSTTKVAPASQEEARTTSAMTSAGSALRS